MAKRSLLTASLDTDPAIVWPNNSLTEWRPELQRGRCVCACVFVGQQTAATRPAPVGLPDPLQRRGWDGAVMKKRGITALAAA